MQVSDNLIDMLKGFEGLSLEAYRCAAGVLTIGYGHTGPEVVEGLTLENEEAATDLLRRDLAKFEEGVLNQLNGVEAAQNQFDAMVDLAFNIGLGNFATSSVLARFLDGDIQGAADAFMLWHKATVNGVKQPLRGLVSRRAAERAMFLGDDWKNGLDYGKEFYRDHYEQ